MATDTFGKSVLHHASQLNARYARKQLSLSSVSLVGGFLFDAVTLKRIDMFWENFWVVVHLLVVAFCIYWMNREQNFVPARESWPAKLNSWLINILQFFFGGLLSTFMVFYFRSGTFWVSWPFYLLLTAAFIANEKLKSRYARLDFQLSLFFLSLFCFVIFILPVVLHAMGRLVFLLSGILSLLLWWLFVRVLRERAKGSFAHQTHTVVASSAAIFILINVLYFMNVIPPLPLSLQDASVHHSIIRTESGAYLVQSEKQGWLGFFRLVPRFHVGPGVPIYFYSAVFSPTSLNTEIIHEWQTYDSRRGWITADRIALSVRGGRDGGYRTYSVKSGIKPGAWRVNVESSTGAILGRYRFNVLSQSGAPATLETELKN
jgi:MFS family permease